MLRHLLSLILLASSLAAQSSVWKVTRGGNSVYLGGTIHMLRATDFPLPAEFDVAFAASQKLYFETDIGGMHSPEIQARIAREGVFTDGKTLEKVLTPQAWKAAQEYCARAGLPLERLQAMKPWLFTVTLALIELQKLEVKLEGVDHHFHKLATENGKATGSLETIENHLNHIFNLGRGHESEMIRKSIDDLSDLPRVLTQIIAAWRSGDMARLDKLMIRDMREKYPAVFKDLLADRNAAWLPKIEAMLASQEVEFVLAGVGHMPGKEGLLALLRARGCTVEQITAPQPQPAR